MNDIWLHSDVSAVFKPVVIFTGIFCNLRVVFIQVSFSLNQFI